MRMYAIAHDRDTVTGLRLAGIEGCLATTAAEVSARISAAEKSDSGIAVLLITETCAALVPERVQDLRLSSVNPLLVVIPDSGGSGRESDSITRLIREAIGVKI